MDHFVSEAVRNQLRALLVRAATAEAARQAAVQRGDLAAARALEDELRRLWARHADLEAQSGRAA